MTQDDPSETQDDPRVTEDDPRVAQYEPSVSAAQAYPLVPIQLYFSPSPLLGVGEISFPDARLTVVYGVVFRTIKASVNLAVFAVTR